MELDQGGPSLAELAIVFRQAAEAVHILGRERAQLGFALVAPGQNRGRMADAVRGGAVAGGLAAAGVELVDGTFEQFADLEQRLDELLVLVTEFAEELAMVAGTFG